MSYNVFLWGFDSELVRNTMTKLEQDGIINIKKWFIFNGFTKDTFFLHRKEAEPFWDYEHRHAKNLSVEADLKYPPDFVNHHIYKNMIMILHNLTRYTDAFRMPFHESLNIIGQIINRYYTLILQQKPDIIIFSNIPHFVDGTILYFLAEALKIKTLFFAQTSFEKKMNYCFSLADYGKFNDIPTYDEKNIGKIVIEEKYEKNLPYMTEEQIKHWFGQDKSWKTKLRAFCSPYKWMQERLHVIHKGFDKYENADDFFERKILRFIEKHFVEKNYYRRLNAISEKNVGFGEPYVYFPLHMQPEMTTDVMGGIYTDQLMALEQLRRILPENWKIYVKENPKQKAYKRGKEFFARLASVPNSVLVDRSVDTYKLTASSKFVATITGTAAWEAVSGGKPALIFGHNWYDELPGIFHYHDGIDAKEIANCQINHQELEAKVANCMKKMVSLVLYEEMLLGVDDFDKKENEKSVYNFFRFILPYVK